jgi:hypothetical protein
LVGRVEDSVKCEDTGIIRTGQAVTQARKKLAGDRQERVRAAVEGARRKM